MILSMVECGHYKGHERTGQTAEQTLGAHSDTQERKSSGVTCTVIPATDAHAALHSCFLQQAHGHPSRPTVKFSKAAILKVSVRGWDIAQWVKVLATSQAAYIQSEGPTELRTHSMSCFLTSLHLNEHVKQEVHTTPTMFKRKVIEPGMVAYVLLTHIIPNMYYYKQLT